ncbi:class I SAM-dependent methyltransferase [Herbaspirillum sp. RTI4]|uniref:class I SAM-dependent methyltransferase n=1 Tax=Herbaspirillum sp. RTI4 TaxID=3048640 RepID=UPI002AB51378|nr:class I SAM-dependent methyltransferase [Herbaspirillum sp. RTI4]MDY7578860.1 class I SAM-dependent methyltransferase [Herbaspirillum sp. RTI4]MEA9983003.1 class I SAM-dependent methyltransferase [Herbaspirillum sp. RTI4]
MNSECLIEWTQNDVLHTACWQSANGSPPPAKVLLADDTLGADLAYRLACEGTALLWQGDFQNARQLLQALARRCDALPRPGSRRGRTAGKRETAAAKLAVDTAVAPLAEAPARLFHRHRQARAQRARVLGMLLIPFDSAYGIPLRRAPDVQQACMEAYGKKSPAFVMSLRELLGVIGGHEWRVKGVQIPVLQARIHPHYGVFSPVRGEYIDLVAQAPLPASTLAFDIGTGSGVLAAVLAQRGVARIVATDSDPRALECARDNMRRLGYASQVEVVDADLFPPGRAPLIVCNPPWLPATPSAAIEHAIYDPDSRMLKGFLNGLAEHLTPQGEGWLILSDFAEHLGLRSADQLAQWIAQAGLHVVHRQDIRPRHPGATDASDPLHAARAAEVTSLWRLAVR